MSFTIRTSICAAALSLIALSSQAIAGVLYECDMKSQNTGGWISQKIAIAFLDSGKVSVVDGVILHFGDQPVDAKVSKRGDRMRVLWSVKNAKDDTNQRVPEVMYSADVNTKTLGVNVVGRPVSSPQRWVARGKCKTRTQ